MNKVVRLGATGRHRALHLIHEQSDSHFFKDHPDRNAHIRRSYDQECEGEFWSLGTHERNRRRIVLWRVPRDNPHYDVVKQPILKIPFLAFVDETIEDRDDILLPIVDEIMKNAAGVR